MAESKVLYLAGDFERRLRSQQPPGEEIYELEKCISKVHAIFTNASLCSHRIPLVRVPHRLSRCNTPTSPEQMRISNELLMEFELPKLFLLFRS